MKWKETILFLETFCHSVKLYLVCFFILHTHLETKFYLYLKFSSLARSLSSAIASKNIDWTQHGKSLLLCYSNLLVFFIRMPRQ